MTTANLSVHLGHRLEAVTPDIKAWRFRVAANDAERVGNSEETAGQRFTVEDNAKLTAQSIS